MPTIGVDKAELFKELGQEYVSSGVAQWFNGSDLVSAGTRRKNSTNCVSSLVSPDLEAVGA